MLELLLLLEKFARMQYLGTCMRMRITFIPALLHAYSHKHTFMSRETTIVIIIRCSPIIRKLKTSEVKIAFIIARKEIM